MQIRQLECFIKVAELRSISKVAKELYMTPPGVAKQINALEQVLGFRLFERDHRGVCLTDEGREFLNDAVRIVSLAHRAITKGRTKQGVSGRTITVGVILAEPPLTDICTAYYEQSTLDAQMQFKRIPPNQSMEALLSGDVDVFMRLGELEKNDASTRNEVLYRSDLSLFVNRGHPLSNKDCIDISDLHGEKLAMSPWGQRPFFDHFRNYLETRHPQIEIVEQMDTASSYMAVQVNGCFALTIKLRKPDNASVCVRPLSNREWPHTVALCMICRNEENAAVDEFVKIAKSTVWNMMDKHVRELQETGKQHRKGDQRL